MLTPVSAFLKIAEHSDYAFLLESVEGGEHVGRYSFLGKDPFLILALDEAARRSSIAPDRRRSPISRSSPTVRELMAGFHSPFVPGLPRFTGGAVGYLGYDAAAWFEPVTICSRRARRGRTKPGFMLFDTVLAFDHVRHRILIIANARITGDEDLESLYQFACAKIEFVERELDRALSKAAGDRRRRFEVTSNVSRERVRADGPHGQGSTSPPATSIRSCCRSASRRRSPPIRSPSIARSATSIRRRTCISSASAVARSSARRRRCWCASKGVASRRIRSPARGRAARNEEEDMRLGRGAEAQREGARRARDARRPRAQRRRPRLRVRHGASADVHGARALLARDAPGVDRRRQAGRRLTTGSMRSSPVSRPAPCPARRRCARWRSSPSSRTAGAASMPARSAISTSPATSTSASRSAPVLIENGQAYVQAGAGIVADSNPAAEYEETRDKARAVIRALGTGAGRALTAERMVLVIDNYDSFTYNLVQYLGELGADVRGAPQRPGDARRDRGDGAGADRDLAGPGPARGRRHHAGRDPTIRADDAAARRLSRSSGDRHASTAASVVRAHAPMHGKTSTVVHDGKGVFAGISEPFPGRALSLAGDRERQRAGRSRSGGAHARKTARSWRCGTARIRCTACSFIPSRCSTERGAEDSSELPRPVMFTPLIEKLVAPRGPHHRRGRQPPCAR